MMLRRYAEQNSLYIVDEYIDDGYSGTNFNRPNFQRMIGDIEAGRINCVVVKDLSRFGRNYLEMGMYTEMRFPELGVRFIAVDSGVDSNNQQSTDDVCCKRCISNASNTTYSQLICGRMI